MCLLSPSIFSIDCCRSTIFAGVIELARAAAPVSAAAAFAAQPSS
jgi:hypothetical protein